MNLDKSFYQEKEKLEQLFSTMSPRQIANELHISYKLVNLWLVKHNLITRTPSTKVP
jgi:orotate phosphoribosyltransferase-like protein